MSETAAAVLQMPEQDRAALDAARRTYEDLERDFFAELAVDHYVLSNEYDGRAADILPTLLNYAVRVEERMQGIHRKFSKEDQALARARKAAELLPRVRTSWQKQNFTYEFCATRRILWEALVAGLLECGYNGEYFDPVVAKVLLKYSEFSDKERKTRLDVLRAKFDEDPFKTRRALRFLLSQVSGEADLDRTVIHFVVKSAIRHSELSESEELAGLLALAPYSLMKKEHRE